MTFIALLIFTFYKFTIFQFIPGIFLDVNPVNNGTGPAGDFMTAMLLIPYNVPCDQDASISTFNTPVVGYYRYATVPSVGRAIVPGIGRAIVPGIVGISRFYLFF